MKEKLALLFLCLLVLGLAQDGCQESRLNKLQSGEILLNPNDLGAAGANKNYLESLSRGNFGATEILSTAVAIAGFQTSCSQTFFSLIVDIVEPQNENTKLKLVIDFRNKDQTSLTTWTKVKLSYLVASYARVSSALINEGSTTSTPIWATSQYIDLKTAITDEPVLTDAVLLGATYNNFDGCGLIYSSNRWRYGIKCDATSGGGNVVEYDVAVHTYIMGFHYVPDAGATNNQLAAEVKYNSGTFSSTEKQFELAFYDLAGTNQDRAAINADWLATKYTKLNAYAMKFKEGTTKAGPIYNIPNQNDELLGIKISVVFSVVNAMSKANGAGDNGFGAQKITYSYSGLFSTVDPTKFNIKTLIEDNKYDGYNNLHERLPVVKYAIYGFSGFALADGSGCTSFSLDITLNSVNAYTVSTNQASSLKNVFIQSDQYFPQTQGVCTPSLEFDDLVSTDVSKDTNTNTPVVLTPSTILSDARKGLKTNLKYIKTRISEKYQTIPSSNIDQYIMQTSDNPLSLNFVVMNKKDINQTVQLNAEIVMSGLTAGKSYGIYYALVPQTQAAAWPLATAVGNVTYDYSLKVNGFTVVQKSYTADDMAKFKTGLSDATSDVRIAKGMFEDQFGINVVGNTATFAFNVSVPRDPATGPFTQNHQIIVDLFEIQQVYDPSTQCCVSQCPAQNGVDVTVTPPACVACDTSKGLSYDPSTSSCKCADSFYLSASLLYQCFPCETKLCAVCQADKPKVCKTCINGASLSFFDNTCACSNGFFENNGTCTRCPSRCSTCSVASTCNTCADTNRDSANNCSCITGFYDAGVDKCATCSPSCATCSSATTCTSCDARKFRTLNNTLCVCQEGYFELIFENGTRVCTKCSSECKTCSQSSTECTGCDANVNRVEGYDSLGHRTCVCKAGYRAVSDGGCVQSNCKSDKWCSQCEADLALCVQCQANVNRVIKLPEHICVCADGFYEAADGTCKACSDGCAKCSSATKCDACVVQATNNGDGTCKCATGTFFGVASNGVRYCQQCIQYCDKCANGLTCQTCKNAFVLSADNTCVCPKNNYINAKGDCVPCKAGCETCYSNTTCDKCQAPLVLQQNNCIQKCSESYFLSGAKCIGCPTNCVGCTSTNQCYYCKDGFFLQGGACYSACPAGTVANRDTFQCAACNKPCKTCVNHPSSCTSCEPGEGYLQITGTDQKCVKECAEGTFPKDGVCQVCDFRCAKCLGAAGNCIACPAGRYLYNAACWDYCPGIVDANGRCVNECPPGYFRQSDQECKICSPECKTCSNNSTCLTCANDWVSLNGKCVKECGNGYYAFRGQCVACAKSCKTCANNPLQCTSCADGFISSNGRCVSSCASGQYLDGVSRTCRQCSPTCATCSSEQFCTTCPNDKIVPVGGQCLTCIYPCANCSADLSVCNACQSGFYLSNGDCVRSCPSGTRPVDGVCSCASGLILDGACVSSCPSGFTRVGSGCQRCESPCTECSTSINFCTDCLDTFTLRPNTGKCEQSSSCNYGQIEIAGKCSRSCDSGLYFYNGACIFGGCPSGFKDNGFGGCVSSSVSTGRCESPTFKLNGACTDNCGNGFFPNTNTRNCESCSANCQSCLNNNYCLTCGTGFTSVDGRCVAQSSCPATQFSYNAGCVASCPTGTFTSNGRCVRSCPSGSFYFGNVCYDTCPTEAALFTDNACVSTCPSGTTLIDNVCATVV